LGSDTGADGAHQGRAWRLESPQRVGRQLCPGGCAEASVGFMTLTAEHWQMYCACAILQLMLLFRHHLLANLLACGRIGQATLDILQ
jgi:hypothetical protein